MKSSWRFISLQIERRAKQVNSRAYKLTKTQQLTKTSPHLLAKSKTHQLKNLNPYLLFYNVAQIFAPF